METIAIKLSVFLIALVVVIFIFSFFISWKVASLQLRIENLEKDINNLGDQIRINRAHILSRMTRQEIKFNEVVNDLNLPSKLKIRNSDNEVSP